MATPFSEVDEAAIAVLVDRFYAAVRADAELGPVFEAAVGDWPAHLQTLTAFWSSVMLGSGRYSGDPVGRHRELPIRPGMFERWLGHWRATTDALFTPELAAALQLKAGRIAESLESAIRFRRGAAPAR